MANNQAPNENQIDYIELATSDIARIKKFYTAAFGWKFTDYGPNYTSFADGRLNGGFHTEGETPSKGILLVLYSSDLDASQKSVLKAGGKIVRETYPFPGGKRFHFTDPDGNEFAVWTE